MLRRLIRDRLAVLAAIAVVRPNSTVTCSGELPLTPCVDVHCGGHAGAHMGQFGILQVDLYTAGSGVAKLVMMVARKR